MSLTLTMSKEELRFAVVSDIHLGHPRNPAEAIIKNLDKYLSNNELLSSIDILFLAGDVFDQMLNLSDDSVAHIDLWIARLLRKCHRLGVMVRVLEGTPSHDRGQSRRFVSIDEMNLKSGKMQVELRYVDTLEIEYIAKHDIHVLYVPDEWGPTTADTLDQVRSLLAAKGLTHVDIAIMHGLFGYQLNASIPNIPRHDEEAYHEIVKGPIFIGHIHVPSSFNRITAQGSFDRLSFGEEDAKGFVRCVMQKDYSFENTFIENKGAAIYKTISCQADEIVDNLFYIENVLKDVPVGSHLRIEAHYANAILSNLSVIKERWPLYVWTSIARGKERKESEVVLDHKEKYVPIVLDRQNLKRIVMDRLQSKSLTDSILHHCNKHLTEITGVT